MSRLSNEELLARVKSLTRGEQEATALLVAHLADLDGRRLYLAEGFSSLFAYCVRVLHLSEHAAYNRIECARISRRFPAILDLLADGSVHLTAVRLLAPHLTAENHAGLLGQACHLGKREIEELVASVRPRPDVPSTVRKLPSLPSEDRLTAPLVAPLEVPSNTMTMATGIRSDLQSNRPPTRGASFTHGSNITPLAPDRYRVQFTADRESYNRLREARNLLKHEIPDGDVGLVLARALRDLVESLRRRKHAAVARPRATGNSKGNTRCIPAAVRRGVWARDGGACAFVSANGTRCGERGMVEYHHCEPFSVGGRATVDNIALRCRAHNAYEELRFIDRAGAGERQASMIREEPARYPSY